MPLSPVYRGFYVQQVIQLLVNGEAVGTPLRAVPLGSMVQITLQITTPDDIDSALRLEVRVCLRLFVSVLRDCL